MKCVFNVVFVDSSKSKIHGHGIIWSLVTFSPSFYLQCARFTKPGSRTMSEIQAMLPG